MKINKVTTLRLPQNVTDTDIQAHFDEQNANGWELVAVDNLIGWYRFFWSKVVS